MGLSQLKNRQLPFYLSSLLLSHKSQVNLKNKTKLKVTLFPHKSNIIKTIMPKDNIYFFPYLSSYSQDTDEHTVHQKTYKGDCFEQQ